MSNLSRKPGVCGKRRSRCYTPDPFDVPPASRLDPSWHDALESLLLEEANKPQRTVAGCVPAPRLVGIELNPGPTPFSRAARAMGRDLLAGAIGDAGAALGAAAASAGNKQKKGKKKKRSRTRSTVGIASASVVRSLSTPLGVSNVPTIVNSASTPTFTIPFDVALIPITSNSSGYPQFGTGGVTALDLDPNQTVATGAGNTFIFGNGVGAVSGMFARWRLTKLRAFYIPMVSSSTQGALTLGYCSDAAIGSGNTYSFTQVASLNGATTVPVWQGVEIPLPGLIKDWLWVHTSSPPSGAGERISTAGALVVSNFSGLATSNSFGLIRLVGVIEFSGLGDNLAVLTSARSERKDPEQEPPFPTQKVEIVGEQERYITAPPSHMSSYAVSGSATPRFPLQPPRL